jgi:hypothetical protein
MTRMMQLRIVAALAIAAGSLGAPSAWAFSTENLNVGGANSRYADPDSQVNGHGVAGPLGSTMHFGAGSGLTPYNRFQGSSNFGGANANYPPPQPYSMPPGNGGN